MDKKDIQKRQTQYDALEKMLKSIVYIEIGNTSSEIPTKQSAFTRTKKKYAWELYVKKPKGFEFEEVLFDINMGNQQAKPISVRNAPYSMQNKGTFSFSCEVTIKPKNR